MEIDLNGLNPYKSRWFESKIKEIQIVQYIMSRYYQTNGGLGDKLQTQNQILSRVSIKIQINLVRLLLAEGYVYLVV